MRPFAVLIVTLQVVLPSIAQERRDDRSLQSDTLTVTPDGLLQLPPFLVPGSLVLFSRGLEVDSTRYSVDNRFGRLHLDDTFALDDTLVVRYRALPLTFQDVYRSNAVATGEVHSNIPRMPTPVREGRARVSTADDLFGPSRLKRSGSITRGIIAGNNQDATIESGLRMQLSGEIVDGVNLRAVLTDENTPILPEGTTQRINEFDRVFIEVSSNRGTAQLGDFDLALVESEFAQFNRKLQGAKVQGRIGGAGDLFAGGSVTVAGATSQGTYRSQEFSGLEGVQGPYRLEGLSGERFIIVVPATEVVYLDGRRLTRGETNDYVIDYATAEITFTPQQQITANKRIVVEFQYSTNQFTRSLVAANATSRFGTSDRERGLFSVTVIREADSREFNEEFGLTSADSLLIAQSGDGIAARTGAEQVVYDPESPFVQYVKEARVRPDGGIDTVLVALTAEPPPDAIVYRVQFTRLGSGQGSYVRTGQSVNGILYEFRGAGMGEYEPVRILPKPRLQQILDVSAAVRPVAGIRLFGEWAASTNNLNRLSQLDQGDDNGHAYTFGIQTPRIPIGIRSVSIEGEARTRFVASDFRSFNRIRPVEFGRRWNLDVRTAGVAGGNSFGASESTDEVTGTVHFSQDSFVRGEWGAIRFGHEFNATRRAAAMEIHHAAWPSLEYHADYVTSDDRSLARRGDWIRQTGSIRYPDIVLNLTPAVEVEHEDRRQRDAVSDSLTEASLGFVEIRPALTLARGGLKVGTGLDWRKERFVLDGDLRDAATAWTARAFFNYSAGALFSTDGSVGYRRRRFRELFRVRQSRQNSESVILRWNGNYRPLQRAVDVSWFYEAQTERTPKLQEIYVRTGPELGQFVWNDLNNDGAIQIDEFIPETIPNEGNYVKTFVPSDTLFAIIGVQARIRLGLDPARRWRNAAAGWKRALSQVTTRTTVEVLEKSREQDLKQIYLLNQNRFRKPGRTLNGRLVVRQEVGLFKVRSDVGVDLLFSQARSVTDLAAGLEKRFTNLWQVRGRVRPARRFTTGLSVSTEVNRVESLSFASRQFDLRTHRLVPEVSFSPSRSWQLTMQVDVADKNDRQFERSARILKIPLEVRHNRARKLQITARYELADVSVSGTADGFAQFELTDGRGTGTSMLWSAGAQYSINQYIRATFSYDGRAPANAPVLHTLRMQVSAIF